MTAKQAAALATGREAERQRRRARRRQAEVRRFYPVKGR
jgi:hypothetical protein